MTVEVSPPPSSASTCRGGRTRLLLAAPLPFGRGVERFETIRDGRGVTWRAGGDDVNHHARRLPGDLIARLDPEPIGNGLGDGDLELRRDLGHVLTIVRAISLLESPEASVCRPRFRR